MCRFRLPQPDENGHSYILRALGEAPGGMAPHTGMDMETKTVRQAPDATTARALGEALSLEQQHGVTVIGHPACEARDHECA